MLGTRFEFGIGYGWHAEQRKLAAEQAKVAAEQRENCRTGS